MIDHETYAVAYLDRDDAYIVVKRIDDPYGSHDPVISVGCTLKGDVDNPTWKVHIPVTMLPDVLMAIDFAVSPKNKE
jgi:hypothetical protein